MFVVSAFQHHGPHSHLPNRRSLWFADLGIHCVLMGKGIPFSRSLLEIWTLLQESWLEDASPEGWWFRLRAQPTAVGLEGVRVVEIKMVSPLTLRNSERALKVLELGHICLFPMPQRQCQPPFLCV